MVVRPPPGSPGGLATTISSLTPKGVPRMATVQGIVSPSGVIVRRQGQFSVVSRSTSRISAAVSTLMPPSYRHQRVDRITGFSGLNPVNSVFLSLIALNAEKPLRVGVGPGFAEGFSVASSRSTVTSLNGPEAEAPREASRHRGD